MAVTKKSGVKEMPGIGKGVELLRETAEKEGKASERGWSKGDLEFRAIGSTKLVSIENTVIEWHVTFRDDGMLEVKTREGEATVDPKKLPRGNESVIHSTLSGEHDEQFVIIAKIAVAEQERIKKQLPPQMR